MALPVLNHGALGEIPANIAETVRNVAFAIRDDAVSADGRLDYAQLMDADVYGLFQGHTRILRVFSPDDLSTREERLAFWVNLYNVLAVHGVVGLGVQRSVRDVSGFSERAAYDVGGYRFCLDDIRHGVLRGNRWKHPLAWRRFGARDPRKRFALDECDPRTHCALVGATRSSPAFDVYEPRAIDEQLDAATRRFVNATTRVDPETRVVTTASLFRRYRRDFGRSEADVLRFLLLMLEDAESQAFLRRNLLVAQVVYEADDWTLNAV